MGITRTLRQTKRYKEIITILIKYGMGDVVRTSKIAETFPVFRRILPKTMAYSRWEEIRMAIEELGPTFVKLGQMLSNRTDILPEGLINELVKLQDDVLPFPTEEATTLIESELNVPISDLFSELSTTPIASASIGQVYVATLHSGQKVAVKVQRPNIEKTIKVDLEILYALARIAENNIEQLKYFNLSGIVKEFEQNIKRELDYSIERMSLDRFGRMFKNDKTIFIPKSYKEFSTKKIFTMDFVDGTKVSSIIDSKDYNCKQIAYNGAELILKQIFIYGFFHADPHPGNIMIMKNNCICFLDFGMMGNIMPDQQEALNSIIIALVRRDIPLIARLILELAKQPNSPYLHELEYAIHELIDRYIDMPLEDIDISEILDSLMQLIFNFKLALPTNLVMVLKAIVMIENIGRQLYPQFKISTIINRLVKVIIRKRLNPKEHFNKTMLLFRDYKQLFEEAPGDLRTVIKKLKHGQMKIEFEHHRLEGLYSIIENASYRLVFGMVIAALVVGSSLIVHADIAPKWYGIPIIGLIGFIIGGGMSFAILLNALIKYFKN